MRLLLVTVTGGQKINVNAPNDLHNDGAIASEFAAMGGGVKSMYILFCICLRTKESKDVF